MRVRTHILGVVAVFATWIAFSGTATAAFPNFSGCPTTIPNFAGCIDIQNTRANLNIKGFNVPLGESLEIRGAIEAVGSVGTFRPPVGTNGFFGEAVPVPGGLLGIEWIPGNSVLAITELAGPASAIVIDPGTFSIRIPVKVRLVNFLLGMNCHIGSNESPVVLNLITGTTAPPPPNTPISGRIGTITIEGSLIRVIGNLNVDNSFAVPGATRCGLGLGLINSLVNAKLRIPSAAGNNSIDVINNIAIRLP